MMLMFMNWGNKEVSCTLFEILAKILKKKAVFAWW